MTLQNSYISLGSDFYQEIQPSPVSDPKLFLWNKRLGDDLNFKINFGIKEPDFAHYLSGNKVIENSQPIALAYAGHQFGGFNAQLGDGRAHLLGELKDINGHLRDIQLKGSGPTRFSRNGDGRYALGPAIREFIMSEAMFALGVPTTQSLSVCTTGEEVFRESIEPGAVVARVASSHLRVGSFEYFAARQNFAAVESLMNFAIEKHYPDLKKLEGSDRAVGFLNAVIQRQIYLVTEWMRIGFIHGVLNTDNTTISGETIDYGPCAMMGVYDPQTVFSSIDHQHRYAFGNQVNMIQWNMARLAETLLPLIDDDRDKSIEIATSIIDQFSEQFDVQYHEMMVKKLGLNALNAVQLSDRQLVSELLVLMETHQLDYTITFYQLTLSLSESLDADLAKILVDWLPHWHKRLDEQVIDGHQAQTLMQQSNPVVIPRNHHMENTIQACLTLQNGKPAEEFIKVLSSPYEMTDQTIHYQDSSAQSDPYFKTFCGT